MQLAEILKTLDIDMEIDDGALVTDVLVIAKVQRLDGATTVIHCTTEGTDWITAIGLSAVAHRNAVETRDYEG
jgi:hypothetical protein